MAAQRTLAAQAVLSGAGRSNGADQLQHYLQMLNTRVGNILDTCNVVKYLVDPESIQNGTVRVSDSIRLDQSGKTTEEVREALLSLLLSEAQGSIRPLTVRSSDVLLAASALPVMDSKLRFQLGVGLAKLGLFELSMKHVRLAATPWEAPLYALRAMLVLAPVHTSVRSLAAAVDQFESQAEAILLDETLPRSYLMQQTCSSPEDSALVLQSLPLLHLAGFSAPYHYFSSASSSNAEGEASLMYGALGYSTISLSALLSEVYHHVCPPTPVEPALVAKLHRKSGTKTEDTHKRETAPRTETSVIRIGVVAGSFDNIPGRIMIGILESMSSKSRQGVKLTAMCFPTPRDGTTDRVNSLFDDHINLATNNKTLIVQKIVDHNVDFLFFADAGLDSRVFALAHERLALHQGALWHWGGTLGVPTIDYYLMPEIFWKYSKCALINRGPVPPQALFSEQVVLLEGLPYITAQSSQLSKDEVRNLLQSRYLLPLNNQTHIYVFPGSVKHLHPEFDRAIDVILKTDPLAMVVLAVSRSGRDNVPPTHIAVRHDLMHPSQPAAAVAKCLRRLRGRVGVQNIDRVRVLPPVDEAVLRGLQQLAVAVLDPFPVGLHLPVLQAMLDQVPVLTSYALQECTNSHAFNLARYLNISSTQVPLSPSAHSSSVNHHGGANTDNYESSAMGSKFQALYPTTPEEYGVWAVRLQREPEFRAAFIARDRRALIALVKASKSGPKTHGEQLLQFVRSVLH